jgi:hypothetical protein
LKTLISALCALFAVLFALTFYVAGRSYDGLVEEDYYRKANGYLELKEKEKNLGLTIRVPGRLAEGRNRLLAEIDTAEGPLRGARASLRAMRLSGPEHDRTFLLREEAAGMYAGEIVLPAAGRWMILLAVEGDTISTQRRWIVTARERNAAPEAVQDIHEGPVTGKADGQAVILDITPKPVTAMAELDFTVELPGYDGSGAPFIDLGMPGMRMPPNRVILTRQEAGRYRGKGIIVRCGSGKRTWTATVTLPGGKRAVFAFDVVS